MDTRWEDRGEIRQIYYVATYEDACVGGGRRVMMTSTLEEDEQRIILRFSM